ncbi:hypothetical protein [Endozoicomonas sp. 4G]|uniref:hypothetical protein n=1 Tax=Endozoicomonas sp. 4G TaxID=2872754 RepID=UPI00207888CA|nr:hypothetical protein [Endozoicomonas sp. 4G]
MTRIEALEQALLALSFEKGQAEFFSRQDHISESDRDQWLEVIEKDKAARDHLWEMIKEMNQQGG